MWFNRQLEALKREKIIKYIIAKSQNNYAAWNEYKRARNLYKTKIEHEKNYINKTISNSNDQKQMWNNIKDLVLKSNRNVIKTVMIFNNVEYKTNAEITNNFNEYYVNSIREIRNK